MFLWRPLCRSLLALSVLALCLPASASRPAQAGSAPGAVEVRAYIPLVSYDYRVPDPCGFSPGAAFIRGEGSLSGYIRDSQTGAPVVGAIVQVCGHGWEGSPGWAWEVYANTRDVTDTTGHFHIRDLLVPGVGLYMTYALVVLPQGSSHPRSEILPLPGVTITESSRLDIDLKPGATLSGVVTDGYTGQPISGTQVYARFDLYPVNYATWSYPTGLLWIPAVTDAAGQYTLTNLSTYSYTLLAEPVDPHYDWQVYPDFIVYDEEEVSLGTFPRHSLPITASLTYTGFDFSLPRKAEVTGTVAIASSGQPVSGARVRFLAMDTHTEPEILTGPDGSYQAFVPAGSYWMAIDPPASSGFPGQLYYDYSRPDEYPLELQIQQGEVLPGLDVFLRQPGAMSGRVRFASGAPVRDAEIIGSRLPAPIPVKPDGSFEISGLVPRTYTFIADYYSASGVRYEAYPAGYPDHKITIHEGETLTGVEFIFPDPTPTPQP